MAKHDAKGGCNLGGKAEKKSACAFCAHDTNDGGKSHAVPATDLRRKASGVPNAALIRGSAVIDDVPGTRHDNVKWIIECSRQYATKNATPANTGVNEALL